MSNISKIPDNNGCLLIPANLFERIDSNGLECEIKPCGADVFVSVKQDDNAFLNGYLVKDGETFTFCGKIYVYAKQGCNVYFMKYRTL